MVKCAVEKKIKQGMGINRARMDNIFSRKSRKTHALLHQYQLPWPLIQK